MNGRPVGRAGGALEEDEDNVVPLRGAVVAEAGGEVDECAATLCVYGEDLDPEAVTALLGVKPSRAFTRSERVGQGRRDPGHGGWFLQVRKESPHTLEDSMRELLAQLSMRKEAWDELLKQYRVKLSCALHLASWNRGFGWSAALMKRIAELEVDLDFDIYSYAEDDSPT